MAARGSIILLVDSHKQIANNTHMSELKKQTYLDVGAKSANTDTKMPQPKIRTLSTLTIVTIILALVAVAEIWWLFTLQ